jgi:hypothetical protein
LTPCFISPYSAPIETGFLSKETRTHLKNLEINTRCENIQKLAQELKVVDPTEEISFRGKGPKTLRMATKHCKHAACPVPSGIIKSVEVSSGLALPKDSSIQVSQAED